MSKSVTVAAPLCLPASREAARVRDRLSPYHFALHGVSTSAATGEKGKPLYWLIRVTFSDQAAAWGEYVLMRLGYPIMSKLVDPANVQRAANYVQVPTDGAWYAPGCQDKPKSKTAIAPGAELPGVNPPTPWDKQPQAQRKGKRKRGFFGF